MMIASKTIVCQLLIFAICPVVSAQVPLTLQQVLHQVRANSPALRVERFNVNIPQANQVTANLRPNPLLNNQTLFEMNQTPVPGWPTNGTPGLQDRERRQFWLQATKEFDVFNKRPARNRFAEANTTLAVQRVAESERNLLLDAANRYVDAWYAQAQISLLQLAQNNADTMVQLNQVRLRNVAISASDLLRTKLVSEQYKLLLNTTKQELRNRLNQLRFITGSADSVAVTLNDSQLDTTLINRLIDLPIDSLQRLAVAGRTDIRVAQASLETARQNVALQHALARPRNEAGLIWNPQNTILYGGTYVTLELPVYNRNQGGIARSTVLEDQASLLEPFARTRIRLEVENAYQTLVNTHHLLNRYNVISLNADRVLASVQYAYLRGAGTFIDWLQAQRSWFDTRKGYAQAVYSYRQAYIRLLYTTGLISTYP